MPLFFDIETQNSFQEVGGRYPELLRLSVAVTSTGVDFHRYTEQNVADLITELAAADLVVGFNLFGFDYPVLQQYSPNVTLADLPTLDMMRELEKRLGHRVGLNSVASATLKTGKSADGLQAVQWWHEGRIEDLFLYCEQDVDVTRRVYEFGQLHHYVQYFDRQYKLRQVTVNW